MFCSPVLSTRGLRFQPGWVAPIRFSMDHARYLLPAFRSYQCPRPPEGHPPYDQFPILYPSVHIVCQNKYFLFQEPRHPLLYSTPLLFYFISPNMSMNSYIIY